jgi:hypothetical protein
MIPILCAVTNYLFIVHHVYLSVSEKMAMINKSETTRLSQTESLIHRQRGKVGR